MSIRAGFLAGTLVAGLLGVALAPACGMTLYVSPDGRDAWSGRLAQPNEARTDGPLASLQGARDALRKLRAEGPLGQPLRVQIAGGVYVLEEPVVFTPEDSGTAQAPVTYEAAPGEKPTFVGGRRISGFQPAQGELWAAKIPQVAAGEWYFEQLWVNGKRAIRARLPKGIRCGDTYIPRYFYIAGPVGYGVDPATGQKANLESRAFRADLKDVAPLLKLKPAELRDVNLVVYYSWESARLRPQTVEALPPKPFPGEPGAAGTAPGVGLPPAEARVITTGPGPWKFNWLGRERYHLENLREALTEPGEWFLDRDGTLLYWPLPGEDLREARVVAPVLGELVRFTGDAVAGLPVEHITLRGLAFHYAGYTLPPEGHGDGQAAVSVPAVVMADAARDITLERCEIAHTGTNAVWLRRGCQECAVRGCHLYDLGAGGVKIGETGIPPAASDATGHNTVDSNLIHAGGRLFTGAEGVWIGQSSDNQVTHNDISDLFYTGVSLGWSWGYAETTCRRNHVEFNHIHHLGWGVMSDMGGVYTLGLEDGATVSNNVIHDVWTYNRYGAGALGLYNDEGSTHITMENNLVYDCMDLTYGQHYGRENVVRNNLLVNGQNQQINVFREEPHLSITFENNVVWFKTGRLWWVSGLGARKLRFDHNVYWNAAGKPFDFLGLSFADWQAAGLDQHSLIADPLFVDVEHHDFHLRPDSPALKLGFKPFDYTRAGIQEPAELAAQAKKLTYPPVPFAPDPPPPPPLVINDDFEGYPVGAPPLNATVNVEGKGDSIAVTDETSAGGKQSLKFTDAEGLQFSFNPHLVYSPDYAEGVARCSFDLRLEEGAEVWHEYRDWSVNPYTIGPSLQFIGGKLKVGDRELMSVPRSQWFHVAVQVVLGDKADGTWQLAVTLPGEPPRVFTDLRVRTPGWKKLTWVGFVSNATKKTVFYLDNLRLGRQ